MCTRLVVSAVAAMILVAAPNRCLVRAAHAGMTVKEIVDGGGELKVGPFTFKFDADSVSTNRKIDDPNKTFADEVIVDIVDSNGLSFSFNPEMRIISNMTAAQFVTFTINYTASSPGGISSAGLSVGNHFAANTANGASSQLVETLRTMEELKVGTPTPANSKQNVSFGNLPTSLAVENTGTIQVPIRGDQGNADEAQLRDIVNTFNTVAEPGTLMIFATLALAAPVGLRRRRV